MTTYQQVSVARTLIILAALYAGPPAQSEAATVYSNDFEASATGFTASGSLSTLTLVSLPTDSLGLASPNQSMWLGRLGSGVAKSGSQDEIVTTTVTGLTPGVSYDVAFDLFIGASWDGSASSPWGPDSWRFAVDGVRLIETTFTNGNAGQEYGAYSPQRYSDTTYTSTVGVDFPKFTGAEELFTTGGTNYGQHYAIYRFGTGAGNPVPTFIATGTSATLEFARFGNTADSGDEYWALDNFAVTPSIPEPSSLAIVVGGVTLVCGARQRCDS